MYGQQHPHHLSPGGGPPPSLPPSQQPQYPQQFPLNPNFYFQNPNFYPQNPSFSIPPQNPYFPAHNNLLTTGETLSEWLVSQSALIILKINAFIHCFVGSRKITSLYDLSLAICKNEGIERFEDLRMGSLLRHPLVHYFYVRVDTKEVHKITSQIVISYLADYIYSRNGRFVQAEGFLELHITSIQDSKRAEESTLMDYVQILEQKCNMQNKESDVIAKAPCIHSQKKELDKRFSTIAQRIKLFSPLQEDLDGKHIRFLSSESEAESDENYADDEVGNKDVKSLTVNHGVSSQDRQSSGKRASTCPYPSASEEMTRLGMKIELDEPSPDSGTSRCNTNKKSMGKKRKGRYFSSGSTPPSFKFSKRSKLNLEGVEGNLFLQNDAKNELINNSGSEDVISDLMLSDKMMDTFIITWKDACHEKKYKMKCSLERQKKKMKSMFSSYPCIGLLNIAIKSIKCGMWDNLYDAIQSIGQHGRTSPNSASFTDMERIDVEVSAKKDASSLNERASQLKHSVSDILKKIVSYFEYDSGTREGHSEPQKQLNLLKSLREDCELWLTQQFSVKEFDSLGYDNFSSLPNELYGGLSGDMSGNSLLEVSMLEQQLITLLSQAASGLWGNDAVTSHDISLLLKKQFPTISFQVGGNDPSKYFSKYLKEQEKSQFSSCVLFSVALSRSWYEVETRFLRTQGNTELNTDLGHISGARGSVSSKDAVDCLLRAPMLSDLLLWSHWDLLFAPYEANTKELLCIVAALQGSSFQTAVSAFFVWRGEASSPSSLKNSSDSLKIGNDWDVELHGQDKGLPVASRFILECLGYLPSEFWSFAADLFLSGLTSFTREAPAAILLECNQLDQRMMLHEIGFSLGIKEWMGDYHALKSSAADGLPTSLRTSNVEVSNLGSSIAADVPKGSAYQPESDGKVAVIVETDVPTKICSELGNKTDLKEASNKKKEEVSNKDINDSCGRIPSKHDEDEEATLIIESIRREEFGLVPGLTQAETSMLKKHHARLGRALQCLSQELYSQDSHFLLELVQNADDNVYSESVEPTLVFILQATGIIVLNNERGFSAQNIRALCDVGNSTKKGASAGYIGQKGIGFKSVFSGMVTDAPEIHSKGFHVKFDISEGQIGFVLPEVVSPCDIDLYGRIVPGDVVDQNNVSSGSWKTCIILPFKPKLKEGTSISSFLSMFSDLHPSLLLFLHRLRCIKFKNMLTNECVVLRRETLEDGIVKISHGKEKLSWFVASQKLHGSVLRPDVQTTEISIAFTLDESADGQRLSAHDVIMVHILPGISDVRVTNRDNNLMAEYLSFVMLHLQSNCPRCCNERGRIISELRNKVSGYKRLVDIPIHFSQEFGNPVDVNKLIDGTNFKWLEIDIIYLKCNELGVSDFVQITQVERKLADVPLTDLKSLMYATDLIPFDSVLKDWESPELVQLVSALSSQNNNVKCKYLLEVLDEKWDNYFGLKANGCCISKQNESDKLFKSSFIKSITDIPRVVGGVIGGVIGGIGGRLIQQLHYPKDLFHDCDTVRSILGASVPYVQPQVRSRKFVSDMGFKTQVTLDDALQVLQVWRRYASPFKTSSMGPSIIVPLENVSRHDDVVHGMLLSQDDVYWHDPTGSVDLARKFLLQSGSINKINCHLSNTLVQVYHGLHDFFVHGCGISQTPPSKSYIQILMQLSDVAFPLQATKSRRCCLPESTVLPTLLDKWVSLHPTFAVVCWCDDGELKKQFKHFDNISFLYFGELSNAQKEMLSEKISGLMQSIGVPALSEVITREAIFYGVEDNKDKASLVDWILPFAQRYISKMHPDKYFLLKQAGFENMSHLQVVGGNSASNRRSECSCLIQGEILYVSRDSDTHSIFLDLSRLFYNGIPDYTLQISSTWSQPWLNQVAPKSKQKIDVSKPDCSSAIPNEQYKRKLGYNTSWPPADWKTAPDFNYSRTNGLRTRTGDVPLPIESSQKEEEPEGAASQDHRIPLGYTVDWNIESVSSLTVGLQESTSKVGLQESTSKVGRPRSGAGRSAYRSEVLDLNYNKQVLNQSFTVNISDERDQISSHTPNATDQVAFDHLAERFGEGSVNWVIKEAETGLLYDIVVCKNDKSKEKDWFSITPNEWQFAVEKGGYFSVVHVVLSGSTMGNNNIFQQSADAMPALLLAVGSYDHGKT
ncbi:hypothetical protein MKX03_002882 [Papaver bracteatum]|nr:hypothetical protein MKX03_002882 [Papaver bracteatum]